MRINIDATIRKKKKKHCSAFIKLRAGPVRHNLTRSRNDDGAEGLGETVVTSMRRAASSLLFDGSGRDVHPGLVLVYEEEGRIDESDET